MATAQTQPHQHIGDTRAMMDHDRDLIHELSKRLDAVWRYDQYIANAEDKSPLQDFWRKLKKQDVDTVEQLKQFVKGEIEAKCF